MAGQLKVNGVTLATEESGTVTLEAPQIKDSSNNVILDQSGTNPILKNVEVVNNSPMMFRNKIINGDMRIDQRNAGASVTPTGDAYTLDRWSTWVYQSSKFSVQQNAGSVTPPVGFSNYLGITSTSAYSVPANEGFAITQKIEGYNVADLGWGAAGALTVTLSFWVRSSLTGTFGGAINNSAQSRSYPFTYEITLPNTWEYKTITIDGDTSGTWLTTNGTGSFVKFGLGVGSDLSGTAGSWATANYASSTGATSVVGTSGATFYITGVQLEVGTVATQFEHRPIGIELNLCQRYYQKSYDLSEKPGGSVTYPSQGTFLGTYNGSVYVYSLYNSTYNQRLLTNISLKTRMRSASGQTIKIYNPYNGDLNNVMQSGGGTSYSTTIANYSESSPSFYATVTGNSYGNAVGDIYRYHWVVENEL